jgi:hypothetical protein
VEIKPKAEIRSFKSRMRSLDRLLSSLPIHKNTFKSGAYEDRGEEIAYQIDEATSIR